MEFLSYEGWTAGGVAAGIVSAAVETRVELAARALTKFPITHRIGIAISCSMLFKIIYIAFLSLILIFLIKLIQNYLGYGLYFNIYIVGLSCFSICLSILLIRFSRVGIHAAQIKVRSGVNYKSALDLCKSNIAFLGTGAAKLTEAANFEKTINRCNSTNSSFRFLLSKPNNEIIARAERMAGVSQTDFSFKIKQSLRKLKKLKIERNAPIEVRFYPSEQERDFQDFRMMFIDSKILLLSQNAYGKGDGGNLPQLIIRKTSISSSERSFYFSFDGYFERLWKNSEPWNFSDYLGD